MIKSPIPSPKLRGNDKHGSGAFGASRGARKHEGVDIVATPGENVFSPMAGEVSRVGYAYGAGAGGIDDASPLRYIEVRQGKTSARLFYVKPCVSVGQRVKAGDALGTVQSISIRYPGITPHIHFELRGVIDPTPFIFGG